MAYDEAFADRIRDALDGQEVVEKKMFGGIAFMINTHMAVGTLDNDLMVRVGKDHHDQAISDGATEMDFTGRSMRGFVRVPADLISTPEALSDWAQRGVDFAQSEPPKAPKKKR